MKSKSKFLIGSGALMILVAVSLMFYQYNNSSLQQVFTSAGVFNQETPDHLTGRFTSIVDEQGNIISMMARFAASGDELYTSEGRHYRVEQVQGDNATAKFLGMDPQIVAYNDFYAGQNVAVMKDLAEKKTGTIAIYHSHSDESYVPSDGTETIPFKGGIYQVGKSMVDRLQGQGLQVNYNETPHDPHDNNAYNRSRRTATTLMKSNPAVLFDVHRDGIPDPNYYRATIDGKKIAKLRLVVGRENPRMSANMDFAKQMMASANNLHPKVVKEIFVGKGDYNQDLMPTALLIEAGTHTNTKAEAAAGLSLMSEAIPAVLGISPSAPGGPAAAAPATPKPTGTTAGSWKALGWILGLTIIGGLGFLLISSGNLANAKKRLAGFGREFSSFLGPRPAARKIGKKVNTYSYENETLENDLSSKETEITKDPQEDITKQ
ncbi:MAG: Stage II sporulation protein P (SpoIIP) [Pelotomaculum sp. PtaB.Bin104]|nr:MAG: Stage II sporulation protein P (SpoIIP) [Pelotomaculum sp. PtaB.Bin104]